MIPKFVEFIPSKLENGVLYISEEYATATHLCCCGCGREVVTPLTQTDWKLTKKGDAVSLHPSIGNWSFPCQSHYWIIDNEVKWAGTWSKERIEAGRERDKRVKGHFYRPKDPSGSATTPERAPAQDRESLWSKIKRWWASLG